MSGTTGYWVCFWWWHTGLPHSSQFRVILWLYLNNIIALSGIHLQKGGRCSKFFQQVVLRKSIINSGILISAYTKALKRIFWCFFGSKSKKTLPSWNSIYSLRFLSLKTYCCHWKAVLPSHRVQPRTWVDLKIWPEFARNSNEAREVLLSLSLFWSWQRSWAPHRCAIPVGCFLASGVLALIMWNQSVCIKLVRLDSLWSPLFLHVKWDHQLWQSYSFIE